MMIEYDLQICEIKSVVMGKKGGDNRKGPKWR